MQEIIVKCYSGHTYDQEPCSLVYEGEEYTVDDIIRMWREPEGTHFLVRAGGHKLYGICYNEANKQWYLAG